MRVGWYKCLPHKTNAKYDEIEGMLNMTIILIIALVLLSVILGYAIGRSKAEREFGEVILGLEEMGVLKFDFKATKEAKDFKNENIGE